jgi:iron complex outermembrane recepter protein
MTSLMLPKVFPVRSLLTVALLCPLFTQAQSVADEIQEIVITAVRDASVLVTDETLVAPPDTAQLLRMMPGANLNKNGELTGIAQYRGMYGDRINISVNGSKISSGGPNAMDAPLHYAPVAILESLTVHRGITPVSIGQETIGGSMDAKTYGGNFADSADFVFNGRIYSGLQSVNNGHVASATLSMANASHLFSTSLMTESADNSEFSGGEVLPSEYERERIDLGYSFQDLQQELSVSLAINNTGDAGTPALPMDIQSIDSQLLHVDHRWEGKAFNIVSSFSYNTIEHWMTNYHLRRPPQDTMMTPGAMRYRATFAESDNYGFSLKIEQPLENGLRRIGVDGHWSVHDADISNPNAMMFGISNFNQAKRDILGIFLEQEVSLSDSVGVEAGLRVNKVAMDAGKVSANLNPMALTAGMPVMMNNMAAMLANGFNNQQLDRDDTNLDWFARLSVESSDFMVWYLGAARKMRAPSYQERYLWLPMEATGGLADGITYIGNTALDSETSHEVEAGFDYKRRGFSFYPRVFYKKVDDYIQGTPATNMTANQFAMMMVNMGMGTGNPLQFNNVDARLYGLDLESHYQFNERLGFQANVSMVRGARQDINDNLYRISPDNILLAANWTADKWTASLESITYASQDRVSATNRELTTGGYSLLNLNTRFYPQNDLELGLGINNVLDRDYRDHQAGYNRAFNPDIAMRDRLPGLGRNIYGRLIWQF